jgi:hypothetical protein
MIDAPGPAPDLQAAVRRLLAHRARTLRRDRARRHARARPLRHREPPGRHEGLRAAPQPP